jgi:hypothetical protein
VPALAPSALSVYEFLAKHKISVITYPSPHHCHYTALSSPLSLNTPLLTTVIKHPSPLNSLCCVTSFFSKNKMALKGRRFSDITVIEAKLQDTLAEFQALLFIKCFE